MTDVDSVRRTVNGKLNRLRRTFLLAKDPRTAFHSSEWPNQRYVMCVYDGNRLLLSEDVGLGTMMVLGVDGVRLADMFYSGIPYTKWLMGGEIQLAETARKIARERAHKVKKYRYARAARRLLALGGWYD